MRVAVVGMGLIGALAAAGCADQATTQKRATGQEASVMVCAPGSFQSGNDCLPVKVDCPAGTALQDGSCVAAPVDDGPGLDPPDAMAVATPPGFEAVVDARRGRLQPRSRQLLLTELQALERLFQTVPKDSPDRPRLMRRLAEGYVELAAAAARDGQSAGAGADSLKMGKIEKAARAAAIKYYQSAVQQYPKFCQGQSTANPAAASGCADEILYFLSLEYLRSDQKDKARKSLLQLIQNHPRSSFIGHAYFQFGEMFFAEAVQDPSKWAMAEQTYLETAKYHDSPVAPYALVRLAEVYANKGDTQKAQAMQRKVASEYPSSGAAKLVPGGQ